VLSDSQWISVSALLEEVGTGIGRPRVPARRILEGILWVLENDGKWIHLPVSFPAQQTCYNKWLAWKKTGVLDTVLEILDRE